jgi:hypothetical protein
MKSMSKQELYKHKASKYYLRYKMCKQQMQKGGSATKIEWMDTFLKELEPIYASDFVITGSGAVTLYLNYYNEKSNGIFNDLISIIQKPNDADFLYCCKGTNYESRRTINNYNRKQDSPQRSVTYDFNVSKGVLPSIIKKFDLLCLEKISYSQIDKYKVLALDKLLDYYLQELKDNQDFLSSATSNKTELEAKILSLQVKIYVINKLTEETNEQPYKLVNLEIKVEEEVSRFSRRNGVVNKSRALFLPESPSPADSPSPGFPKSRVLNFVDSPSTGFPESRALNFVDSPSTPRTPTTPINLFSRESDILGTPSDPTTPINFSDKKYIVSDVQFSDELK